MDLLSSDFEIEEVIHNTNSNSQHEEAKKKRATKKTQSKKQLVTPSNEKRVQATNDDSIVSKRSASRAGYFEDNFLKFFVPKLAKRSPFINRGYYIRCHAIRYSVTNFLQSFENHAQKKKENKLKVNIVNVGAGFDSNFFHFSSKGILPSHCKYYELDFPDVVSRKKQIIQENSEFHTLLKNVEDGEENGIKSEQYVLIDVDLRDIHQVERKLKEIGKIEEENITLVIAECVMTYIPHNHSSTIIQWASSFFPTCLFVTYEQILPSDGFGQVMRSNLANRGSPLLGISYFPNVISQRERYLLLGFEKTRIMDINSYFETLSDDEIKRIESLDEFDEEEDWKIKCSHYFLAWSWKDPLKTGIFDNYVPIHSPVQISSQSKSIEENSNAVWLPELLKGKRSQSLRWGHTSNKINNKIVVFGGYGQSHGLAHSRLNDIVVLDVLSMQWLEPHCDGVPPSKRIHHSSSVINESQILIFGGREAPSSPLNDCFIFDVIHSKWILVNQSGDIPSKRYRHATCRIANSLYLFGGKTADRTLNDLYSLDLNTFIWTKLNPKGDIPSARYSHSLTAVPSSSQLILFGGVADSRNIFGDVFQFNISTLTWKKIEVKGEIPSPRYSHAVDLYESEKYLVAIGGISNISNSTSGSASDEIFRLEIETWKWEKLSITIPLKNVAVRHSIHLFLDNFMFCIGGGCICFSFGSLFSPTLILSLNGKSPSITQQTAIDSKSSFSLNIFDKVKEKKQKTKEEIPRIFNPSKEQFMNEIYNARKPVIFTGVDMGICTSHWNPLYLINKFGDKETSVHVCKSKRMDFINKNFTFQTMKMSKLVSKMYDLDKENQNGKEEETKEGVVDRYYLRSMGINPRKDVSDIWDSFPEISRDFQVPEFVPMAHRSHSSYFSRMSSRDCQMWTHFDVMDNILCEIKGDKKVVLWAPSDVSYLYVSGSTSHVLDIDNPDIEKYPLFIKSNPIECILKEGEILFIPAYWFHNVLTMDPCIAVNIFWKHMPDEFYYPKDLYGNRDPVIAAKALDECQQLCNTLSQLPPYYRDFYVRKIISSIKSQFS